MPNEVEITVIYKAYPEVGQTRIKASGFNPNIHERIDKPQKKRGRPRKAR